MPLYEASLWFREDLDDEYYMSHHRHFGKHIVGVLGKLVSTTEPLAAGDMYEIELKKGILKCRIIELQPSLFGDPGNVMLEPVFSIAPRSQEEIFRIRIIDQLLQSGWE